MSRLLHRVSTHPGVTHGASSARVPPHRQWSVVIHLKSEILFDHKVKFCVAGKGLFALAQHSTMLFTYSFDALNGNQWNSRASANNTSKSSSCISYRAVFMTLADWGSCRGMEMTRRKTEDKLNILRHSAMMVFTFQGQTCSGPPHSLDMLDDAVGCS